MLFQLTLRTCFFPPFPPSSSPTTAPFDEPPPRTAQIFPVVSAELSLPARSY